MSLMRQISTAIRVSLVLLLRRGARIASYMNDRLYVALCC